MPNKYPYWCHTVEDMKYPYKGKNTFCKESIPQKIHPYPCECFKDRLTCLLGDEVLFSVDARLPCDCRTSFCGTLCYIGCDFIIVNVTHRRKPLSMHIPIDKIRFIAPYCNRRK